MHYLVRTALAVFALLSFRIQIPTRPRSVMPAGCTAIALCRWPADTHSRWLAYVADQQHRSAFWRNQPQECVDEGLDLRFVALAPGVGVVDSVNKKHFRIVLFYARIESAVSGRKRIAGVRIT